MPTVKTHEQTNQTVIIIMLRVNCTYILYYSLITQHNTCLLYV